MIDIGNIDAVNIESFLNSEIALGSRQARLLAKDIIIDQEPIARFCDSVCQHIGQNLKILFIYDQEFEGVVKKLKENFISRGFLDTEYIIEDWRVELKTAKKIASSLQDDARVIIAAGGDIAAQTAKITSLLSGLPLAVYYAVPECDGAFAGYSWAFHNNIKDIYKSAVPSIICVDLEQVYQCGQKYLGAGIGITASKYCALFDWYFSHLFNLKEFDYQISDAAFRTLERLLTLSDEIIKKDKKAYQELIQTQLKLSALTHLSQSTCLMGGAETGALNVLEMFFHKENRPTRQRGENLFLCAKIILRAYKNWLTKLRLTEGYFYMPDNSLRLEKLTDYLGLGELEALNRVLVIDDYEQWEIMQYKWGEYNEDLVQKLEEICGYFDKYERIFKRVYDDAGFWTTKYLTDTDIMLMIGLAPDAIKNFTLISFVKLTGQLDRYLEGV
ncbi:MAG TPA: iron-containing alcohol dehydrogenase [Clostridia bacterium]